MTVTLPVSVPGPVAITPAQSVIERWGEKLQRYRYLPADLGQVRRDLEVLTAQGGVPATVDKDRKGNHQLRLYLNQYWLGLYVLNRRDGYQLGVFEPLRLGQHGTLLRGHLLVTPQRWDWYPQVRDIAKGYQSHWPAFWYAWRQLKAQSAPVAPDEWSPRYDDYLDTLSELVAAAQEIEQEKLQSAPLIPYAHVEAAADQRYTTRGSYVFRVTGDRQVSEGRLVKIQEEPDLRGKVTQVSGRSVTVRFEGAVDHERIPRQGSLADVVSDAVHRARQRAVETLRRQESRNPHLLDVLARRDFQPYAPGTERPEGLDPEQTEAFQRSLTVPDTLLILGPPGTGKTYTITEIVSACQARGQRVLLSSHTNRAVDNVLERMGDHLVALRVGREEAVAAGVRPLLLGERATELQKRIAERTRTTAERLEPFATGGDADQLAEHLDRQLVNLRAARLAIDAEESARAAAERQVSTPFRSQLDALTARIGDTERRVADQAKRVGTWWARHHRATSRAESPTLGFWFRWRATRRQERADAAQARLDQLRRDLEHDQQQRGRVNDTLRQTLFQDPEYRRCDARVSAARAEHRRQFDATADTAQLLRHYVLGLEPGAPDLRHADDAALEAFSVWLSNLRPWLTARAALLASWRQQLQRRSEQFYPELVRYADVVGATCIGTATSQPLTDVEFDLAIIDEAGQIGILDVLVPLVRAKRAVLVGDHRQLPPFVDDDVRHWAERYGQDDDHLQADHSPDRRPLRLDSVHDLLVKSAFELLFERAPTTHQAMFTRQRRMPKVIADFVSATFYQRNLTTIEDRPHTDELFRRALAFVDTSDQQPPSVREEHERHRSEPWREPGYANTAEATLIRDLVAYYDGRGAEWAVIVPYRAQRREIVDKLRAVLNVETDLWERVGTVDAFQGGERDVIVYGFTRSNPQHKVGFLGELRRLNVAMTRAKRQLVLVGDTKTLINARDAGFRSLMRALHRHVRQHGDLRASAEFRQQLERVREQP